MCDLVCRRQLRQSNDESLLRADCARSNRRLFEGQGVVVGTRYPRIRQVYAGDSLVQALDRIDALAHSDSLIHVVLVQYLDVLEAALGDESENTREPGTLLRRALEAVQEALAAFGLIESPTTQQLH